MALLPPQDTMENKVTTTPSRRCCIRSTRMTLYSSNHERLCHQQLFFILMLFCNTFIQTTIADVITPINDTETDIVGGTKVSIENYPWQAAIFDTANNQFCGGSIISNQVVLTAQHCYESYAFRGFVGFGSSKLSEMVASGLTEVKYVINYPRYAPNSEGTLGKDVTLLVLNKPIQFNTKQRAIQLATAQDAELGYLAPITPAVISGWGTLAFGSNRYPDQLYAAKVKLVSNQFAKRSGMQLTPDQLAAGQFPGAGRVDTCQGDSGGPLVVKSPNGKLLAGATSWGIKCADGKHPGVYSRMSDFTAWINRVMVSLDSAGPVNTINLATFDMEPFSQKQFQVLVPRGLRSVHFNATFGPQYANGARADLFVQFEDPFRDCASRTSLSFERCSFITPLEGVYVITLQSELQSVKNAKMTVVFEMVQPIHLETFEVNGQMIHPRARAYYLALPTIPGTVVSVELIPKTGKGSATYALSPGTTAFSPRRIFSDQTTVFATTTATSVVVLGDPHRSCTFDLRVRYSTAAYRAANTTVVSYSGPAISSNMTQAFPLSKKLVVGTEVGVRFFMVKGSAKIIVRFGIWEAWSCQASTTAGMTFCSGIVPQYNQNGTILVQGAATDYQLTVTYEYQG